MIIKEITLDNFVCYINTPDPITLKFSKGVNILRAKNGGGKSQLFNAFNWVLYDRMYITDQGWEKGYPTRFIPDYVKEYSAKNEIAISVTLKIDSHFHFNPSQRVEYIFTRTIEFKKKDNDYIISKESELEISYLDELGQTNFVPPLENDKVIDCIMPSRLKNYMWFQGETINELIDFTAPDTLKQAVSTLSYYPVYVQLLKICNLAYNAISDKINSSLASSRKLSAKEAEVIREIEFVQKNIVKNQESQEETTKNIELAKEKILEFTQKLNSYDKFPAIEARISEIELEDKNIKLQIENLESNSKRNIIEKWMLLGTEDLIKESSKILKRFTEQIKEKSPTNNPIPMKVPGKVYIQKMLDDEFCYICERKAEEGSPEYIAISKRINESEKNDAEYNEAYKKFIYLEDSYVELADKPNEILKELKKIPSEIRDYRKLTRDLFLARKSNSNLKQKVYDELSISESDLQTIKQGSSAAKQLTTNLLFYKDEHTKLINKLRALKDNENGFIIKLNELKLSRSKIKTESDKPNEYELAEPYSLLLVKMTKILMDNAYNNLVSEIEKVSNSLYQDYLKANTAAKGKIVINRDNSSIGIEDNGNLITLSQGLTTAAKMSVINAILYLSAKKIGISYPLVADAPSSVFDAENTQMYTKKIGDTFEQVIIMSKDYSDEELEKLKKEHHISSIWILENKEINTNLHDSSRANTKTFITKFK